MAETAPIFQELEKERTLLLQTTASAIEAALRRSFKLQGPFKNTEIIALRKTEDFISLYISTQSENNLLIRKFKSNGLPWTNLIEPDNMTPVISTQGGKELHLLEGDFKPFLSYNAASVAISASAIKLYRCLAPIFLDSAAKITELPEDHRLREYLIERVIGQVQSKVPNEEAVANYLEQLCQNLTDPIKFPIIAKGAQIFLMAAEAEEFLTVTSLGTEIHNEILGRLIRLGEKEFIRQQQRFAGKGQRRNWFEIPPDYKPYESPNAEISAKVDDLIFQTNSQIIKNLLANFLSSRFAQVLAKTYRSTPETDIAASQEELEKLIRHLTSGSDVQPSAESFPDSPHSAHSVEQITDNTEDFDDTPWFEKRRAKQSKDDI